jgi:hypothetical protein
MGEWVAESRLPTAPTACVFCELISTDTARWVAKESRAVAFFPLPDSVIAPGQTPCTSTSYPATPVTVMTVCPGRRAARNTR